jgi:hypothetical protein
LQSNRTSLIAILQLPFCRLESFSINRWYPLHWNDFSSELNDALSTIIHWSSLKTLYLRVPMCQLCSSMASTLRNWS